MGSSLFFNACWHTLSRIAGIPKGLFLFGISSLQGFPVSVGPSLKVKRAFLFSTLGVF